MVPLCKWLGNSSFSRGNGRRLFSSSVSAPGEALVVVKKDEHNGKNTGVTILCLNRPKSMNALTMDLGLEFQKKVSEVCADDTIRCVVLTGAGKAFSAGGDLEFLLERHADTPLRNTTMMREFYQRFLDVRKIPVPVISAINGAAVGAGLCLALATDIRIASKTAKLGLTFTQLGIHPGMGATHFLPKLVGNQVASYLLLTGDLIEGEEAKKLGLVLDAVEQEKVLDNALDLARKIASRSPVSVKTCVRSLRNGQEQNLESALWREADAQAHTYASGDIVEGAKAVREKRNPDYSSSKTH